ncbi:uncharacterized protein ACIQIH_003316 isoform 2-T4 [Cyanocitta cristata]
MAMEEMHPVKNWAETEVIKSHLSRPVSYFKHLRGEYFFLQLSRKLQIQCGCLLTEAEPAASVTVESYVGFEVVCKKEVWLGEKATPKNVYLQVFPLLKKT